MQKHENENRSLVAKREYIDGNAGSPELYETLP